MLVGAADVDWANALHQKCRWFKIANLIGGCFEISGARLDATAHPAMSNHLILRGKGRPSK
jgi:hypothetical protein